jgi:RNA polymerase sigma factor (sigma-70 family)
MMATSRLNPIIQRLRRAALAQDRAELTDGQLLEAFIARQDDETFDALLHRHGTMVMGVCFRVLCNHHDSEDAFQATFLVLARKASSVRPREQVANWLHGVAYRTALKARSMRAKRQVRERQVAQMPEPESVQKENWSDLQPLLDEELSRLPETYRLSLLLCDLEGKSIKQATQQLGWPQGTLAGRLARARKMLAKRLAQRGVVLSGGALAVVLAENAASASVALALAVSTTKAAVAIAAGQAAAPSLVSSKVVALMEGVMKGMMLTKLKTMAVALVMLGVVAFGGTMAARHSATAQQVEAPEGKKPALPKTESPPAESRPKSLDEKLQGEWLYTDYKNGAITLIFGPGKKFRIISPDNSEDTGTYAVDWSKNPHHLDFKLISEQEPWLLIMKFIEPGKLRIELTSNSSEPRPKTFTKDALVFRRQEATNEAIHELRQQIKDLQRRLNEKPEVRKPESPPKSLDEQKPHGPVAPEDRQNDASSLQGLWSFQSLILDGNEAPAEIVKAMFLTFKGDKMTLSSGITIAEQENGKIRFGLGDDPIESQFKLRGSNPKQIQTDADKKGTSMTCIYRLNGDKLTLCMGADSKPPVEFTAKKGTKQELWILKRENNVVEPPEKAPASREIKGPDAKDGLSKAESDADFIRRLSKELRGTEPTPAEIHFFVTSKDAGRRQKLIDLFIKDRQARIQR